MEVRSITHGSLEYQHMVDLRYHLLRKPIGLSFTTQELDKEKEDLLLGAFEGDLLVGCCILSILEKDILRLRQMAVKKDKQGNGIGREIVRVAENQARELGYTMMMLHAREVASGFYKKLGYQMKGDAFEEVGISHFVMEKRLK